MKESDIKDDLASIRNLMERSSKFISLSGLSGVLAGVYALIGAIYAYYFLNNRQYLIGYGDYEIIIGNKPITGLTYGGYTYFNLVPLFAVAVAVLFLSVLTGIILSARKAKRKGQSIWNKTSRELLFYMATPLIAGGLLMIIFILRGYYGIVGPASLIFYGLALVGASNFTFTAVRSLGICEIVLGLISALYPGYGLYFWALGFGVLHIIYGSVMYLKYDR